MKLFFMAFYKMIRIWILARKKETERGRIQGEYREDTERFDGTEKKCYYSGSLSCTRINIKAGGVTVCLAPGTAVMRATRYGMIENSADVPSYCRMRMQAQICG